MKNISVIIPCYNTEKYIDKCLNSILNQTYKNLEIILIDDVSSDNTWNKINDYSKKHSNIIAIKNKKNSGAAYSRNIALKYAQYDLISFIDSDDYIEPNYYETMIKTLERDNSDIVVCDVYIKYDQVEGNDIISKVSTKPYDKYSFINNGLAASPCNKLFKKEALLKYPFPEGIMNEDIATVLPMLIDAKKISYTQDTYYNYIQRKNSVQNSKINEKRFDLFKALDILGERLKRNTENKKYWDAIIYNQIITFLFYYLTKEKNPRVRKKYLKKYNQLSKKYNIKNNPLLTDFYNSLGIKHKYYYKGLIWFNTKSLYCLSNSLISFYHWYSNSRKSVIKDNITIKDIIEVSKIQKKLKENKIKISVVIPNYNYEKYLLERLYSILYQNIKIYELIILDDCSKDNSRILIDEIEKKIQKYVKIRKIYNAENSGSAFKQWKKGFEEATGDYVWIAEADDYCSNKFLKETLKPIIKDKNIVISYSDTAFIDKQGKIIISSIKKEIDIQNTGHWKKSFISNGMDEIKNYAYLNCTIANVSSVIFKKDNYEEDFKKSGEFKQAGDWLFYVNVMKKGNIAYSNKPYNFYRVHGNNVTSTTKKQAHLDEIKKVHKEISQMYNFDQNQSNEIEKRYKFLEDVWDLNNNYN